MTEKVVCVVQARNGSSRLPGKVLEEISPKQPMLKNVIERVKRSKTVDTIVIATTDNSEDDSIEELALDTGAEIFRGDTFDVLSRFTAALERHPSAEILVRITADCPFVDPDLIDNVVNELKTADVDFCANRLPPPWTRTFPIGLDVEACKVAALYRADKEAIAAHQREHVMPYIYENQDKFTVKIIDNDEDLSKLRWTVDTPEDLQAVKIIAELCGDEPYGWSKVLAVVRDNPWLSDINSTVTHKKVDAVDTRWIQDT